MRTVLLLTNSFPYAPGEQFLEGEIEFWGKQTGTRVIVVPSKGSGATRPLPHGVILDSSCAALATWRGKFASAVKALLHKVFWIELAGQLLRPGRLQCSIRAWKATASLVRIQEGLERISDRYGSIEVVYCYWNDIASYSAVLLKRHGRFKAVVTRAHGYDLYEELRPYSYMPLRAQFFREFDAVFPVSRRGKDYLEARFPECIGRIVVSRLGVEVPTKSSRVSPVGHLRIVSVAFCSPVKRIDRLIAAIGSLCDRHPELRVEWTHVGGGPLEATLRGMANASLTSSNVSYEFTGTLSNSDVRALFESHEVDVFVNSSDSEGIPVSIMEAMSHGVPSVAPDVGGVAEIVSQDSGILLASNSPEAIAGALASFKDRCKCPSLRSAARSKILGEYNAQINYPAFIQRVISAAK